MKENLWRHRNANPPLVGSCGWVSPCSGYTCLFLGKPEAKYIPGRGMTATPQAACVLRWFHPLHLMFYCTMKFKFKAKKKLQPLQVEVSHFLFLQGGPSSQRYVFGKTNKMEISTIKKKGLCVLLKQWTWEMKAPKWNIINLWKEGSISSKFPKATMVPWELQCHENMQSKSNAFHFVCGFHQIFIYSFNSSWIFLSLSGIERCWLEKKIPQ